MNQLMSLIQNATISLPAVELMMLLVIASCCMVFKFTKIGLVAAYVFLYKWGWVFFAGQSERYLMAYLVFGGLVGVLSVIGMLMSRSGT